MAHPVHLLVVLGTRPEAVKLAPLVLAAAKRSDEFRVDVVSTGQHVGMLAPMLSWFGVVPAFDLELMRPAQTLNDVTVGVLNGLHKVLSDMRPDWVVVQGDTTTTFAAALAAFYAKTPVAHVEAGLRTRDRYSPFPEEGNRVLTSALSTLHFAPTVLAKANLLDEGYPDSDIFVTGNTCIDALTWTRDRLRVGGQSAPAMGRRILVTAHRRENHGEPMSQICQAILLILDHYSDVTVEFPVHLSPRVRDEVIPSLAHHDRVHLMEPLGYPEFVAAMDRATIILTDSGGVQEEGPSLGKPVLVMRESTERPEAVHAGTARLVGTDPKRILKEVGRLLDSEDEYLSMSRSRNPYGDGHAASRILDAIADRHSLATPPS